MESVEKATVVKVFEQKVWIESDFLGARHVVVQHDDGVSEPFDYCTFNYDYRYTSNGSTLAQATKNGTFSWCHGAGRAQKPTI